MGLFTAPYHPERHYMRGPGPACLKRQATGLGNDGTPLGGLSA